MKQAGLFLRLVRWQNLVFIAITQVLFHYCIVVPSSGSAHWTFPLQLQPRLFYLLCVASIFIAGAGYIINDYFDINIDEVNKPQKMIVDRFITRRMAIFLHWLLSGIGLAFTAYVSYQLRNPLLVLGNLLCVMLLWVYSTTYKRRLLIGNILISAMTAWVILVLLVAEMPGWWNGLLNEPVEKTTVARLWRIGVLYASFAFVISLVREVVKDIEDVEGDRRENCRTLPIVYGINAAKIFAANWLVILLVLLLITQIYVLQFGWWHSALYVLVAVFSPLLLLFRRLLAAQSTAQFSQLSHWLKWIMLTGILSMFFFYFYAQ